MGEIGSSRAGIGGRERDIMSSNYSWIVQNNNNNVYITYKDICISHFLHRVSPYVYIYGNSLRYSRSFSVIVKLYLNKKKISLHRPARSGSEERGPVPHLRLQPGPTLGLEADIRLSLFTQSPQESIAVPRSPFPSHSFCPSSYPSSSPQPLCLCPRQLTTLNGTCLAFQLLSLSLTFWRWPQPGFPWGRHFASSSLSSGGCFSPPHLLELGLQWETPSLPPLAASRFFFLRPPNTSPRIWISAVSSSGTPLHPVERKHFLTVLPSLCGRHWPCVYWALMASDPKEWNFTFYLICINLNLTSHTRRVATILDSTA